MLALFRSNLFVHSFQQAPSSHFLTIALRSNARTTEAIPSFPCASISSAAVMSGIEKRLFVSEISSPSGTASPFEQTPCAFPIAMRYRETDGPGAAQSSSADRADIQRLEALLLPSVLWCNDQTKHYADFHNGSKDQYTWEHVNIFATATTTTTTTTTTTADKACQNQKFS